ncbi:MAG: hypothetical protein HS111_18380 [Kofleriaceae bacterium]|nr:hypothetical protein [Kofleriaceae bacterium]MCL4227114.1 hypothetical protein [Myxococcales bacterium]
MVRDQRSARPAQRKGSLKSTRSTKKSHTTSAAASAGPTRKVVSEKPPKPLPPKVVGELPVPIATFFL